MTNIELATRLYDLPDKIHYTSLNDIVQTWLTVFTRDELVELWEACKRDFGIGTLAFDDEVYNALHAIGYFDKEAIV